MTTYTTDQLQQHIESNRAYWENLPEGSLPELQPEVVTRRTAIEMLMKWGHIPHECYVARFGTAGPANLKPLPHQPNHAQRRAAKLAERRAKKKGRKA